MRCTDLSARLAGLLALAVLAGCHSPMPPDPNWPPRGASAPQSSSAQPYSRPAETLTEYRMQFASRLVARNPDTTYTTPAVNPLLAIPVLEIEVNRDGSVRDIEVVRQPTQATETVQMAIDAVRRAAPFGDASHVPRPWKFREAFLFDEDHRFKPRILD